MSNIAVVYWSGTGNTEAMANLIAEGAQEAGAEVKIFQAADFSKDKVADFDALAFGCPSMGDEQLEDSEFEPMFTSVRGALKGKKVALFGSYGWGDGEWMRQWQESVEDEGISLIGDGLIVNDAPDIAGEAACKELGAKLSR